MFGKRVLGELLVSRLESRNRLECQVQGTKYCNGNNGNRGPLHEPLAWRCCCRIVMLHLLRKTIEHNVLLSQLDSTLYRRGTQGPFGVLGQWRPLRGGAGGERPDNVA